MKVLEFDAKRKQIVLRVETLEDLFWLMGIIEEGDLVTSTTTRRIKLDRTEKSESKRVTMKLTLCVTKLQIDSHSQRLRVSGVVREGPEKYSLKGQHHTFNMREGSKVKVAKSRWHPAFLRMLERARETSAHPPIVLVVMDDENSLIGTVGDQGVRPLMRIQSHMPSKRSEQADRFSSERSYFKEVADAVENTVKRSGAKASLIGGPGFVKKRFLAYLSEKRPSIAAMSKEGHASSATVNGLHEMIRRGEVDRVLKGLSISLHSSLVQDFLASIARNPNLVAYGLTDVQRAVKAGAAKVVLILSSLLFSAESKGAVVEVMDQCSMRRTDFHILTERSEPGAILKSFGGIASILRYPLVA